MWKIRASFKKPYWINQNGFKPHPDAFKIFCDFNLRTINGNINFVDFFNAEITLPNNTKTYYFFELTNTKTGEIKYFYLNNTGKIQGSLKVFTIILDIYTTYTIPFLKRNENVNVIQNRTQNWNPKLILREDTLIQQLPLLNNEIILNKQPFNHIIENGKKWYQGPEVALSEANNVYKYAVFSNGPSLTYRVFPIFKGNIRYNLGTPGELLFKYSTINAKMTGYLRGEKQFFSEEDQLKLQEAYKNNKIIKYEFSYPINDEWNWIIQKESFNIAEPFTNPFNDFKYEVKSEYERENGKYQCLIVNIKFFYKDNLIWEGKRWLKSSWEGMGSIQRKLKLTAQWLLDNLKVTASVYDVNYDSVSKTQKYINCSETIIEQLLKNPEYTNKFLGIYAGPHLLQMKPKYFHISDTILEGTNLLYITLEKNGIDINQFIFNIPREEPLYWNSNVNSNFAIQNTTFKYRNTDLKIVNLFNNGKYQIGGRVIFTNGFKLISKQSDLLSVKDSIIDYGGMLPTAESEYTKFVNSQINTINTGYEIQKQMYQFSQLNTGISTISGIASSIKNLDFGGLTKNLFGNVLNYAKIDMQFANYKKQLISKFRDAQNTNGNSIKMSNVLDASIITYYEDGEEQFECLEQYVLDETSKIFINNYTYLYGFADPTKATFKELLELKNPYIEIAQESIESTGNLKIEEEPNIWLLIKEQLINGIKLFNDIDFEKVNLPEKLEEIPPYELEEIEIAEKEVIIDFPTGIITFKNGESKPIKWPEGTNLKFLDKNAVIEFTESGPTESNYFAGTIKLEGNPTIKNSGFWPIHIILNGQLIWSRDLNINWTKFGPLSFRYDHQDKSLLINNSLKYLPYSGAGQWIAHTQISYTNNGEIVEKPPYVDVNTPLNPSEPTKTSGTYSNRIRKFPLINWE